MPDVVVISSKKTPAKIVLAATIALALIVGWIAIKWQIGIMLTTLAATPDVSAAEVAAVANDWSPSDPGTAWLKASATNDIAAFERAVLLAPNDYRWRMELGRALEQNDEPERAEVEIEKAVELAPTYAVARWQLGNFYLRQGRIDEALAELKRAAEDHRRYRDQVFSLMWDYFDKDAARVEALAGESVDARARLAYFFAARGRGEDSLRNWNMLADEEKAVHPETAKAIAHGLFIQKRFPQSLEFSRQLGLDAEAQPETVTNGSFEKGLGESPDARFAWAVVRGEAKLDISADSRVKRDGTRSARFVFKNYVKPELYNLYQTVVVEPGRRYRLAFWVRTEGLKSAGLPLIEIINASNDTPLARSPIFTSGTNDWREIAVEFTTPQDCTGITIRTTREQCGEECPLTGTFWYDDFVISKN